MWNEPTQDDLWAIPAMYATEDIPCNDKIIHMHFFIGGCDWYVAEFDGGDSFFGFAILNNDLDNAEWGYFSLSELKSIRLHGIEVDRDLHWKVRPVKEVEKITACQGGLH